MKQKLIIDKHFPTFFSLYLPLSLKKKIKIQNSRAFGYTGDVLVNESLRDIKAFKQNVAFITQDTSLQPYLTVNEAMHFSANLKIGAHMSKSAKRERVSGVLSFKYLLLISFIFCCVP